LNRRIIVQTTGKVHDLVENIEDLVVQVIEFDELLIYARTESDSGSVNMVAMGIS
jgi:hypothetical protein